MASGDATPFPRKNVAYRVTFPIFDNDGDLVTGAADLDSEVSIDGGTFADVTAEATEIATASGIYFLDLTNGEMNGDTIAVNVKTSTANAKTTPIVLYPEEAGDIRVDVRQWLGTAVTLSATSTKPEVDLKSINDNANAAIRLALAAGQMVIGTVDDATFTPTATQWEADDITEATADHFKNRSVIFTGGALAGQWSDITGYVLANSKGKFTVSALTEAPANNDPFIVI